MWSLLHSLGGPGRSLTTFLLRGTLPNLSSMMQTGTPQRQNLRIPSLWPHPSLTTAVILTPSPKEETVSWCQPAGPPRAGAPAGDGPGQGCVSQWGVFAAALPLSQRTPEISWQCHWGPHQRRGRSDRGDLFFTMTGWWQGSTKPPE